MKCYFKDYWVISEVKAHKIKDQALMALENSSGNGFEDWWTVYASVQKSGERP